MVKMRVVYFFVTGFVYLVVENVFRAITFDIHNYAIQVPYWTLMTTSSLWMVFVGGLALVLIGILNQNGWVNTHLNIFTQSVCSGVIITVIEFISGLILNVWLRLDIWDYSNVPLNLMGQVCLPFFFIWVVMSPLAMWIDDVLYHYLRRDETAPYSLLQIYKEAVKPFAKPFF